MSKLHHCVDEVSEKGPKHVAHKSSVAKLIDDDTAEKLAALAQEGKK